MEKIVYNYILIAFTFCFFMFLYAIDIGASLQNIGKVSEGVEIALQSLVFRNMEPRVVYHIGFVGIIFLFMSLLFMTIYFIEKCHTNEVHK